LALITDKIMYSMYRRKHEGTRYDIFSVIFHAWHKKTHNKECINKHKVRKRKKRLKEKHVRGGLQVDMQKIMPIQQIVNIWSRRSW
jgi:hypothetical protein